MRRWLTLLAIVALAGAGSYLATRAFWPAPPANEDQITWLTREFHLTPEQRAAIEKLQDDYIPVCSDHCAMIVSARERLAERPDDAGLQTEVARLERQCQQATLAHVRRVAACMDTKEGRRFLSLVEPRILHHDHEKVFGLK